MFYNNGKMSLIEQKRLQWAREREEIEKMGEVFTQDTRRNEKTSIRTFHANIDYSSHEVKKAEYRRKNYYQSSFNQQQQQQEQQQYSHNTNNNNNNNNSGSERVKTKNQNFLPILTSTEEDTSGYISDYPNPSNSSSDSVEHDEYSSVPIPMGGVAPSTQQVKIIKGEMPHEYLSAYKTKRRSISPEEVDEDEDDSIVMQQNLPHNRHKANYIYNPKNDIEHDFHKEPIYINSSRDRRQKHVENTSDMESSDFFFSNTPSSSSSTTCSMPLTHAYHHHHQTDNMSSSYHHVKEERKKWSDCPIVNDHRRHSNISSSNNSTIHVNNNSYADHSSKKDSSESGESNGPIWLRKGYFDETKSVDDDESVRSVSFLRGQNIALDPTVLAEREIKRRKAMELQTAIKEQLEERERQRKWEREKQLQEERQEEERLRRQMEIERARLDYEQKMYKEKVEKEKRKQELMLKALEKAEIEAKLEKNKNKIKREKISNNPPTQPDRDNLPAITREDVTKNQPEVNKKPPDVNKKTAENNKKHVEVNTNLNTNNNHKKNNNNHGNNHGNNHNNINKAKNNEAEVKLMPTKHRKKREVYIELDSTDSEISASDSADDLQIVEKAKEHRKVYAVHNKNEREDDDGERILIGTPIKLKKKNLDKYKRADERRIKHEHDTDDLSAGRDKMRDPYKILSCNESTDTDGIALILQTITPVVPLTYTNDLFGFNGNVNNLQIASILAQYQQQQQFKQIQNIATCQHNFNNLPIIKNDMMESSQYGIMNCGHTFPLPTDYDQMRTNQQEEKVDKLNQANQCNLMSCGHTMPLIIKKEIEKVKENENGNVKENEKKSAQQNHDEIIIKNTNWNKNEMLKKSGEVHEIKIEKEIINNKAESKVNLKQIEEESEKEIEEDMRCDGAKVEKENVFTLPHDGTFTKDEPAVVVYKDVSTSTVDNEIVDEKIETIAPTTTVIQDGKMQLIDKTTEIGIQTENNNNNTANNNIDNNTQLINHQQLCRYCCHPHNYHQHHGGHMYLKKEISTVTTTLDNNVVHNKIIDEIESDENQYQKQTTTTRTTMTTTTFSKGKDRKILDDHRPKWGVNRPTAQYIKASERDRYYSRNKKRHMNCGKSFKKLSAKDDEKEMKLSGGSSLDNVNVVVNNINQHDITKINSINNHNHSNKVNNIGITHNNYNNYNNNNDNNDNNQHKTFNDLTREIKTHNIFTEILPIQTDCNGKIYLNLRETSFIIDDDMTNHNHNNNNKKYFNKKFMNKSFNEIIPKICLTSRKLSE